MTKRLSLSGIVFSSIFFLLAASSAFANITPTLSLSNGNNGSVQMSVYGDPNSSVMFYYNVGSASGMQVQTIGSTDSNGSFSTTINTSSYNINPGNSVYVIVNGQQSAMQSWPYITGTPSLSQSSVTLSLGQSATVTSQSNSTAVYMATNSNPSAASIQTNGSQQITVTANQLGSTTATICFVGTASNCASLNINVQNGSVISLSPSNVTVASGQTTSVIVSGGNGNYSITSNSNPSIASAVISGTTITVSGLAIGSANVTVCDQSGNCNTLYITVNNTTTSGSISFSQSNQSITVGQTVYATIYGGSGYYVTQNSNSSIASQSINGSTLTISGLMSGSTNITVCSASNGCGQIYVSVNSNNSTTNSSAVTFGVSNPTVNVGQSMNISISGSGGYFISSTSNSNVFQPSISGNSLILYGSSVGSGSVTVCSSSGGCNTVYVTVANPSTTTTTTTTTTSPTTTSSSGDVLSVIQSMQNQLAQILTQIQSMATTLTQLTAKVALTTPAPTTSSQPTTSSATPSYTFTEFLSNGSTGAEVTALQEKLTSLGYYSGPITGYYGSLTETAVKKFQSAHNIEAAGYVGPGTRSALNGE